jgi:hypothetical protein
MARKLLMVAAVAFVALTSSISIGTAQAHWSHWGYYGWGCPGATLVRVTVLDGPAIMATTPLRMPPGLAT